MICSKILSLDPIYLLIVNLSLTPKPTSQGANASQGLRYNYTWAASPTMPSPLTPPQTKKQIHLLYREDPSKPLSGWYTFQLIERSGSNVTLFAILSYRTSWVDYQPARERFACGAVIPFEARRYQLRVLFNVLRLECSSRSRLHGVDLSW